MPYEQFCSPVGAAVGGQIEDVYCQQALCRTALRVLTDVWFSESLFKCGSNQLYTFFSTILASSSVSDGFFLCWEQQTVQTVGQSIVHTPLQLSATPETVVLIHSADKSHKKNPVCVLTACVPHREGKKRGGGDEEEMERHAGSDLLNWGGGAVWRGVHSYGHTAVTSSCRNAWEPHRWTVWLCLTHDLHTQVTSYSGLILLTHIVQILSYF